MSKFYCPYCPEKYQIHKQRKDGVMICGQCGDLLLKSKTISPKRATALLVVIALSTPLILIITSFIQSELNEPDYQSTLISQI